MQEKQTFDADLLSIQEARERAVAARAAQRKFLKASQQEVDRICAAMAEAAFKASERLGQMAHDETGFGVPAHKRVKNEFASKTLWESIQNIPTVGVIERDEARKVVKIGWPVGVIAGLIPSTNPTSTAMYKILIGVKARNAVIIAPHPSAKKCSLETVRIMAEAGERAGMPPGLVSCMEQISLEGSRELMQHYAVSLILATGGTPMVRAAHSMGKPAIGVGPGNVPVYVDRSAYVRKAAQDIVNSKAFDCSVICATEQAVVADRPIAEQLRQEMRAAGAHWVNAEERNALERTLFHSSGAMNPKAVGKTPQQLAALAGFSVPDHARVLVADLEGVGKEYPLSGEKLTTVLGFYVEDDWHAGCERCLQLIRYGGDGHSLVIHATDEEVVEAFGLEKPVFRILVNTWGTLGAVGATTGVMPSMTLAPGGVGGAVMSGNITVTHLLNVKQLATMTLEPPEAAKSLAPGVKAVSDGQGSAGTSTHSPELIADIVRQVLAEI
ncbi:acetaldehyde dehydrogenase [Alkalispirochaeta americana]|uniref:Acetaldehyde dehydrogenase n=1 Tax=Alkalispirochaeta americana TaxID=159291 RepID=A0A1N6TZL1_9SPIO|nr:aldehyde dehydrogenase family protein [Alkalispirochaeta americana]SIQ58764.1 acetaldehyde dehydrogenase [Alkalispirochaeta americana]